MLVRPFVHVFVLWLYASCVRRPRFARVSTNDYGIGIGITLLLRTWCWLLFGFSPTEVASSDVWLADMNYRVAVTQQARVWQGVSTKLAELFLKMKDIEVDRRKVRNAGK